MWITHDLTIEYHGSAGITELIEHVMPLGTVKFAPCLSQLPQEFPGIACWTKVLTNLVEKSGLSDMNALKEFSGQSVQSEMAVCSGLPMGVWPCRR